MFRMIRGTGHFLNYSRLQGNGSRQMRSLKSKNETLGNLKFPTGIHFICMISISMFIVKVMTIKAIQCVRRPRKEINWQ